MDSGMGETPNQRLKRCAGGRQGKCPQAHLTGLYIVVAAGQPECGLEVLIGCEPHTHSHARTHAGTAFPECSEAANTCVPKLFA